mgnify:FL=1
MTRSKSTTTVDRHKLRELREAAGLRQEDLADIAGVDRGLISKLECGVRRSVTLNTAAAIARALGTTVDSLLDKPVVTGEPERHLVEEIRANLADMDREQLDRVLDYIRYQRRANRP